MANKTISLPEDVYSVLKKQKRKGESFSDLIKRLIKDEKSKTKNLDELSGSLKEDDEWDQIIEDIYNDRNKPARLS
ncbi:MAG: antitoxin VapB family protein [Promethearchaeota archaeon]